MITVVIVSLNSAKYISAAITSVLTQDIRELELLIVDGKSTDGTVEILSSYKKLVDEGFYSSKKMRFISEKDSGIYDAMNKAIELCNSKWMYFLGADDVLLPDFKKAVNKLKDKNSIYYFNCFRTNVKRKDSKYNAFTLCRKNICHQAIIYPIEAIKKYKYDLKYKIVADYYLNLQLWNDKKYSFKYDPIYISYFCVDGVSNQKIDKEFYTNIYKILKDSLGTLYAIIGFLNFSIYKLKRNI